MEPQQAEVKDAGIVCPGCGCSKLPAKFTRRLGNQMIRVRKCKRCKREIRTAERIQSYDASSG